MLHLVTINGEDYFPDNMELWVFVQERFLVLFKGGWGHASLSSNNQELKNKRVLCQHNVSLTSQISMLSQMSGYVSGFGAEHDHDGAGREESRARHLDCSPCCL